MIQPSLQIGPPSLPTTGYDARVVQVCSPFLLSEMSDHTKELHRFNFKSLLIGQYMIPIMGEGEWSVIKVRAQSGQNFDVFVNIKVIAPMGCTATVDILAFWYVVTSTISLATLNINCHLQLP